MAIKRKISEERKQQLRDQLERARAKRKPAEYKNVHSTVLDLPDDHNYSFKTVKGWIKESKEQVAAFNKTARSFRSIGEPLSYRSAYGVVKLMAATVPKDRLRKPHECSPAVEPEILACPLPYVLVPSYARDAHQGRPALERWALCVMTCVCIRL